MMSFLIFLIAAASALQPQVYNFKREPQTAEKLRSWIAESRNGSALIPRHPYGILNWYVEFGVPDKYFAAALSTASVQTFVPKVGFKKGGEYTHYYNPEDSSTVKHIDDNFKYVSGNVTGSGQTYDDFLHLFDFAYRTEFGALTDLQGSDRLYYDGQVGLAWKPYTKVEANPKAPFIHSVLSATKQQKYQFFMKLQMGSILMGDEGIFPCGRYVMHRIPLLSGTDVPMIPVNSFQLNNYQYRTEHAAFLDTANGDMLLPDEPFREVLRVYKAKFDPSLGLYMTACCCEDREWQMTIGGNKLKVTDDQVIVDVGLDADRRIFQLRLGTGSCPLLVGQSDRIQKQTYTLGIPFFYRHCLTFDVGGNQVGITKSVT